MSVHTYFFMGQPSVFPQEQDPCHGNGNGVGDRLREEYAEHLIRKQGGKNENQRYQQDYLSEQCQEYGGNRIAQSDKGLLAGYLDAE